MRIGFELPRERLNLIGDYKGADYISAFPRKQGFTETEIKNLVKDLNLCFEHRLSFESSNGFLILKNNDLARLVKKFADNDCTLDIKDCDFEVQYAYARGKEFGQLNLSESQLERDIENSVFARNIALVLSMDEIYKSKDYEIVFKNSDFSDFVAKNFHEYERRRKNLNDISGFAAKAAANYICLNMGK